VSLAFLFLISIFSRSPSSVPVTDSQNGSVQIEVPYKEIAFNGVPGKNNILIQPTSMTSGLFSFSFSFFFSCFLSLRDFDVLLFYRFFLFFFFFSSLFFIS
jgi:nucleosome binding factor SPN SPT16 subunit